MTQRNRIRHMTWSLIVAAAAATPAMAQTDAQFFVIDAYPDSTEPGSLTEAWTVSPDGGVVVGRAFEGVSSGTRVFRWTPSGGVEFLTAEGDLTFPGDFGGADYDGSHVFGFDLGGPYATLQGWTWDENAPEATDGTVTYIEEGCPCDFDGDPGITVVDLLTFLGFWFASDPAADYNGDTAVDVIDLLDYLGCWFPFSASGESCAHGSEIHAMSGDGSVMVGYYDAPNFNSPVTGGKKAFRHTDATGYVQLPYLLPDHTEAWAFDCSEDGTAVAGFSGDRSIIWDAAGNATDLNAGAEGSMAFAVSPNGQYVAGQTTLAVPNPPFGTLYRAKGYIWDSVNGMSEFDPGGFGNLVVPTAVSNDGLTVVGAQDSTFFDRPSGSAFIWDDDFGYIFFDEYATVEINITNADVFGWRFPVVNDMNGDGTIFTGTAIDLDGNLVGFVLYVGVEPPTP